MFVTTENIMKRPVYIYIYIHTYIHTYIWRERDRERQRDLLRGISECKKVTSLERI